MDILLIPLFISACLALIILVVLFFAYMVPVHFTVHFVYQKPRQETTISACWCNMGVRVTTKSDHRKTEVLLGNLVVFMRTSSCLQQESERKATDLSGIRSPQDLGFLIQYIVTSITDFGPLVYSESSFQGVHGKVRVGLCDPAATGMLYGGYWATRFVLLASRIQVEMEPVFDREILELDLTGRFRIAHPLRLVIRGIRVMIS